jgi:hypothetical protein
MLENYHDTIVEMMSMWPWSILLKCPIISEDLIAIFKSYWKHFFNISSRSTVPSSKITNGVTPFEHAPNQTINFCGNFRFSFMPPFLSASARLAAQIRSF